MQNIDPFASASFLNMITHLSGPLRAGAAFREVPVGADGSVVLDFPSREPLLLAAPRQSLNGESLRLEALLDTNGAKQGLSPLVFAPYTETGSALPLYIPTINAQTQTAAGFTLELTLTTILSGVEQAVDPAEVAEKLILYLVEGVMGKMIYLLGAGKSSIRRQARETAAMRLLEQARDDALDRIGADLGVPRLADELVDQKKNGKDQLVLQPRREPDEEYRARLALFRQFQAATPGGLNELLNGPGDAPQPNKGLLSRLGLVERFNIVEEDNEFAIAIHLVEAGGGQLRQNFLKYLRQSLLVLPVDLPANNDIHQARFLPAETKQRIADLRARLRAAYQFGADSMAFAPMLAEALDRVGRCRAALGDASQWKVLRTQDLNAGSRYELGLGCDIEPPDAAVLDALVDALKDVNRQPADDREVEALLKAMQPAPAADDPEGCWLLEPCGMRTIHRVDTQTLYLSHFPTYGLVIEGGSQANPGAKLALEGRYHAPGDPGANVVLVQALAAAAKAWTAAGKTAWTELTDAQAAQGFEQATGVAVPALAQEVFQAAGLPGLADQGPVAARLKALPGELYQVVQLDANLASGILSAPPGGDLTGETNDLRLLVKIFQDQGVVSILPLVTGANQLVLVLGAIGLPEAGINLSDRRATGFYWYIVPLQGPCGNVQAVGSHTDFTAAGPGLAAVVVVGYARRGLSDPYEYRVELSDGVVLNLRQYEFLMNLLERAYPIGIEINTFQIRRQHVDLDGDGQAEALLPSVARTYRPFQHRRPRGETSQNDRRSINGNLD